MTMSVASHTIAAPANTRVRCVECGHDYPLPPLGDEFGCAACGCPSWIVVAASRS